MTTPDTHEFEADDSGISCTHCGLPEPNARHRTPAKAKARVEQELEAVESALTPLMERRAILRKDALIWEALGYALEDEDITVLPAFGYIAFNVSTFYDHGQTGVSTTLDGIWTQDGTMIADPESDRLYVWEVAHDDLRLQPDDAVTYYFKWWPNVDRTNASGFLSWDWEPIEVQRIDGAFALGGTKCEEFIGERKQQPVDLPTSVGTESGTGWPTG
jgi:hypothetical protein